MKIGIMFPGQGSQHCAMGKEFYDTERIVQEYFEQATACLGINMTKLCFATSDERLRRTDSAQLSIFTLSTALYHLLHQRAGVQPTIVAGHSSGEYAALHAAGGVSFIDGLHLIQKRAALMQRATQQAEGTMRAIIRIPHDQLQEMCHRYDDPSSTEHVVSIANDNGAAQQIIAGTPAAVERVSADVRDAGGRVMPLSVAGAFHSRLMDSAAMQFAGELDRVALADLATPLIMNSTAQQQQRAVEVRPALQAQMNSMVRWRETQQVLALCDVVIQVGPGVVYSRMLQREHAGCTVVSFTHPHDWKKLEEVLV
ncbi:MAG: ACP S-malonyltransferase [Candidatus Dependentiae bacterium]|jgi:[acyl-carrier-protein] S-malonyltransferase